MQKSYERPQSLSSAGSRLVISILIYRCYPEFLIKNLSGIKKNTAAEKYHPLFIYLPALILSFFLLAGCAASNLNKARGSFYAGQPQKAVEILSEKGASKRDKLLFLMEKGAILHRMGQYEESIAELLNASKLIAQQEVISLSRQTASLVTSEWVTEYKGEYCERLWVHTYLMMNYLLVNKYEDALVEAKQALKIFQRHPKSSQR